MSPLFFAVALQVQDGRPIHAKKSVAPVAVASDLRPVTAREARESFVRASGLLTKVHGTTLGAVSIPGADRPASRSEIVVEMARMLKASEPTLRFTPAPEPYDVGKLNIAAPLRASLGRLVALGCVGPVAPLAVGPGNGMTVKEFGDALGFFMARLTQMSHLPSPKWTPMLQKDQ